MLHGQTPLDSATAGVSAASPVITSLELENCYLAFASLCALLEALAPTLKQIRLEAIRYNGGELDIAMGKLAEMPLGKVYIEQIVDYSRPFVFAPPSVVGLQGEKFYEPQQAPRDRSARLSKNTPKPYHRKDRALSALAHAIRCLRQACGERGVRQAVGGEESTERNGSVRAVDDIARGLALASSASEITGLDARMAEPGERKVWMFGRAWCV